MENAVDHLRRRHELEPAELDYYDDDVSCSNGEKSILTEMVWFFERYGGGGKCSVDRPPITDFFHKRHHYG